MLLIGLIIFIAAFLIIIAVYLNIVAIKESPKAELKRRLRQVATGRGVTAVSIPEDLRTEIIKETPPLERFLNRTALLRALDTKLDKSGLAITLPNFLLILGGLVLAGFLVTFLFSRSLLMSFLAGLALGSIPLFYLEFKKHQREEKFTELFPDALAMISRSLRSGHSFTSAVQLVGNEVSDPVGTLFKTAYDQQLLGLRINDTLTNLNNRIDCLDLRFFTTAVTINSEVGGNFAEILDKLADTIRERIKIRRQLRIHTAQGRMSGYVLAVLPIITYFLMDLMIPGYQRTLLEDDSGFKILILAGVLQVIGFLVIRRIINIRI